MDIVPGSLVDQQMQAGQFDPADVPMDDGKPRIPVPPS